MITVMNQAAGFIIKGNSVKELLAQLFSTTSERGALFKSERGSSKFVNTVSLVLENPTEMESAERYPYWDENSEQWYLKTFIEPSAGPPDDYSGKNIFPFTYAWRSRFHDDGWGHVLQVIKILEQFNYSDLPFSRKEDVDGFIRETYKSIHPDVLLATMAWQGRRNIQGYLIQPEFVHHFMIMNRSDLLQDIVDHLQQIPSSPRAVTSSLQYQHLDNHMLLGHGPTYQAFQASIVFDENQNPSGVETFHWQRALDASGPAQLDIAQDIAWGSFIGEQLNLPLVGCTIHANMAYLKEQSNSGNTNIEKELLTAVDGYNPETFDIEERLRDPRHGMKVDYTLKKIDTLP